MKYKVNEKILRNLIKESIKKTLKENIDNIESAIEEQYNQYEQILLQEYEQAQKDILTCKPTFHYGLRSALQNRGYTVVSAHDNSVSFFGKSKLFGFYAVEKSWDKPWILSKKISLEFENYQWKNYYQQPYYYNMDNTKEVKIDEFKDYYFEVSHEIKQPLKLKPYSSNAENIANFTKFTVFKTGGGAPTKTFQPFDDFETAKAFAYEIAKTDCKNGKARRDDLSQYYHSEPLDVTKNHPDCVLAYETYDYDEHTCYVGVRAE